MYRTNKLFTINPQHGFSLIELMLVLSLIGILYGMSAVAYQNYTKKAYMTEAFSIADSVKTAVSEYYATQGKIPIASLPNNANTVIGLPIPTDYETKAIKQLSVYKPSVSDIVYIEIIFQKPVEAGTKMYLSSDVSPGQQGGTFKWKCSIGLPGTTSSASWVPAQCRNFVPVL